MLIEVVPRRYSVLMIGSRPKGSVRFEAEELIVLPDLRLWWVN